MYVSSLTPILLAWLGEKILLETDSIVGVPSVKNISKVNPDVPPYASSIKLAPNSQSKTYQEAVKLPYSSATTVQGKWGFIAPQSTSGAVRLPTSSVTVSPECQPEPVI